MTDREKQIEEMEPIISAAFDEDYRRGYEPCESTVADHLYSAGYRKQTEETLNAIDSFKDALVDKFLLLCNCNDFNKLTLLTISDAISDVFNEQILRVLKEGESGS